MQKLVVLCPELGPGFRLDRAWIPATQDEKVPFLVIGADLGGGVLGNDCSVKINRPRVRRGLIPSTGERSRTPNLLIRSQVLYPIELRPRGERDNRGGSGSLASLFGQELILGLSRPTIVLSGVWPRVGFRAAVV